MTLDVEGDLSKSTHQKILEKEQARASHVVDVLPICHHIVAIEREGIYRGEFDEGTPYMATLLAILVGGTTCIVVPTTKEGQIYTTIIF